MLIHTLESVHYVSLYFILLEESDVSFLVAVMELNLTLDSTSTIPLRPIAVE